MAVTPAPTFNSGPRRGSPRTASATYSDPPAARTSRREFVCRGCGYGVWRSEPPERCPMCHGSDWRAVTSPREAEAHPCSARAGEGHT